MTFYRNIEEIKAANKANGGHFFAPDTIRFFKSRILPRVYGGKYFITSEQDYNRLYTIREVDENGKVSPVGAFRGYASPRAARAALKKMGVV